MREARRIRKRGLRGSRLGNGMGAGEISGFDASAEKVEEGERGENPLFEPDMETEMEREGYVKNEFGPEVFEEEEGGYDWEDERGCRWGR